MTKFCSASTDWEDGTQRHLRSSQSLAGSWPEMWAGLTRKWWGTYASVWRFCWWETTWQCIAQEPPHSLQQQLMKMMTFDSTWSWFIAIMLATIQMSLYSFKYTRANQALSEHKLKYFAGRGLQTAPCQVGGLVRTERLCGWKYEIHHLWSEIMSHLKM